MEQFAPQLVITAYDRLTFDFAETNSKFSEKLSRGRSEALAAGCSRPLPRTETQPPAVVHLVPVRGNARDIFSHAAYFLVATSVDRSKVLNSETLQGLFDLSPAEARVARSLAAGHDVAATARQFDLGVETVRTHVKSVLSKCGMSRQTDLVASIASLSSLSSPD
jgi:DNA-binding CsgD family transcriptional regulator